MPRTASPSERRSYLPPQHDGLGNRIPGTGVYVPFGDPSVTTTTVPQGTLVSGTPVGLFHSHVPTVEYNRARDWAASIDAELARFDHDAALAHANLRQMIAARSNTSSAQSRTLDLFTVQDAPTPQAVNVPCIVHDAPLAGPRPLYSVTHFPAAALFHNGIPLGWRNDEQIGTSRTLGWEKLAEVLQQRPPVRDWRDFFDTSSANPKEAEKHARDCAKAVRGAVSLCSLAGNVRSGSSFLSTQLLGLDIDARGSVQHALKVFDGVKKLVLSTYNSTTDNPRGRVFFPLRDVCSDRSLVQRGHDGLRARLVRQGHYQDADLDRAGSDAERLFYLPVVSLEGASSFRCEVTDGEPLDLGRLAHGMPLRAQLAQRVNVPLVHDSISQKDARAARDIHSEAIKHAAQVCQDAADLGEGRRTAARAAAFILAHLMPPLHAHDILRVIDICTPAGREPHFAELVLSALARAGRVP